MVIFRRKSVNVFNVLFGACDGCVGGSTSATVTQLLGVPIASPAICLLLTRARAIQCAVMVNSAGTAGLIAAPTRFVPLAAFEPRASCPCVHFGGPLRGTARDLA